MTETTGQRLYRIRLACGDGVRDAESQDEFAKRVKRVTKRSYSAMRISLLERMKQKWRLIDVETFAAVDPLKRTREWLAWGVEPDDSTVTPTIRDELTGPEYETQVGGFPSQPKKRASGEHRKRA